MRIPNYIPTGPLAPLGVWVRAVWAALSRGLTFADNFAGDVKTVRWDGTALLVSTSLAAKPSAVLVLRADVVGAADVSVSGAALTWSWVGDSARSVRITDIATLTLPGSYDVTLWIAGG